MLGHTLRGIPVHVMLRLWQRQNRAVLKTDTRMVATTNTLGLYFSAARRLGILDAPVLFLAMGLLPMECGRWTRWVYRQLLKDTAVVTISRGEQAYLEKMLTRTIHYLPFGVDHRFWTPATTQRDGDYILAIGNDRYRDWATLVASWTPDLPRLRIITNLPVPPGGANIEIVRGDWRSQIFSDAEIREQFRGSRFVILPLHDTFQPSGQSACLQAMACGKSVILSDIAGLWDRAQLVHDESILLVAPGSVTALRDAVRDLVNDTKKAARIGARGRAIVESHFNTDVMSAALVALLESLGVAGEHTAGAAP
jgi:glycosyltransferase involved in cell wall biosynthesis